MPQSPALPQGVQFQVEFACELTKVRQTAVSVQSFLEEQGCSSDDVLACQLALVEACNNAVKYATPEGRAKPVTVTVVCGKSEVAITVADHTAGFDLPANRFFLRTLPSKVEVFPCCSPLWTKPPIFVALDKMCFSCVNAAPATRKNHRHL